MAVVYVLTGESGEYSNYDHWVEGVYATPEAAKAARPRVTEWTWHEHKALYEGDPARSGSPRSPR